MEYALTALLALCAWEFLEHYTPWLEEADKILGKAYRKANREWRR